MNQIMYSPKLSRFGMVGCLTTICILFVVTNAKSQEFTQVELFRKAFLELTKADKPDFKLTKGVFDGILEEGHIDLALEMLDDFSARYGKAWDEYYRKRIIDKLLEANRISDALVAIGDLPERYRDKEKLLVVEHFLDQGQVTQALILSESLGDSFEPGTPVRLSNDRRRSSARNAAYKKIIGYYASRGDQESGMFLINQKYSGAGRIQTIGRFAGMLAFHGYLEESETMMKRHLGWADLEFAFWEENVWQAAFAKRTQATRKLIQVWAEFDADDSVKKLLAKTNSYLFGLDQAPTEDDLEVAKVIQAGIEQVLADHEVNLVGQDRYRLILNQLFQGDIEPALELDQQTSLSKARRIELSMGFGSAAREWAKQNRITQFLEKLSNLKSKQLRAMTIAKFLQIAEESGKAELLLPIADAVRQNMPEGLEDDQAKETLCRFAAMSAIESGELDSANSVDFQGDSGVQ